MTGDATTSEKYDLRPATGDNVDALYDVHRAAMFEYVTATWGWDEADQRQRFASYVGSAPLQAIVVADELAGILHVARSAEVIEIVNIELHPRVQGKGIGSRILATILAEGRASARPVELQVLKVNDSAHRLYQRLGFRETGETATHVQMRRDP